MKTVNLPMYVHIAVYNYKNIALSV